LIRLSSTRKAFAQRLTLNRLRPFDSGGIEQAPNGSSGIGRDPVRRIVGLEHHREFHLHTTAFALDFTELLLRLGELHPELLDRLGNRNLLLPYLCSSPLRTGGTGE
jgi:hypothetical protein